MPPPDDRANRPALVLPLVPRLPSEAQRPAGRTLPELWRLWWDHYGRTRWANPNSAKNARRCEGLSASLPPHPSPSDVVVWLAALASSGFSPGTVAVHRDILHGVYSYALNAGWTTSNPVALAPWARPPAPEVTCIRNIREVWPELRRALASSGFEARALAFVGTLRFTGVRLDEGLALYPSDVLRGGIGAAWRLSVVRQRTKPNSMATKPTKGRKGKGRRAIPVRQELRELLAPVLELPRAQLRFGTRGMPRTTRDVAFMFPFRQGELTRIRDRLAATFPEHFGVGDAWHVFRRSFAFELYEAGKPIELISELLGHESVQTTESYIGRIGGARIRSDAFDGMDPDDPPPAAPAVAEPRPVEEAP